MHALLVPDFVVVYELSTLERYALLLESWGCLKIYGSNILELLSQPSTPIHHSLICQLEHRIPCVYSSRRGGVEKYVFGG